MIILFFPLTTSLLIILSRFNIKTCLHLSQGLIPFLESVVSHVLSAFIASFVVYFLLKIAAQFSYKAIICIISSTTS